MGLTNRLRIGGGVYIFYSVIEMENGQLFYYVQSDLR
jgi:hypothetical protein